jgi:hypothetical protein
MTDKVDGRKTSTKPKNSCNKRTHFQVENDRMEITRLYLKGYTQMEMVKYIKDNRDYTLSPAQIQKDIKAIQDRWREAYIEDFNAAKVKELERIDALERTYWEAWEKSREKASKVKSESVKDTTHTSKGKALPSYNRTRVEKEELDRDGDPKFLEGIQWCISQRCKIFGFNAAQKISINWREEAEKEGVNAGEAFNQLVGQFLTAAAVDGSDGGRSVAGSTEDYKGEEE